MIIQHNGKSPVIHESAYVAPTAAVCGDVKIGGNARIMHGSSLIAEGGSIEIADHCIVLENAVLRSTARHSLRIGRHVLIGPNAHVVGCTIEDDVFIATGTAIFHGARLLKGSEVRINGVVHLRTVLPENQIVPIGWIAVGDPAKILPPEKHDEIWAVQKTLNFPQYVYGVDRRPDGNMAEITEMMADMLASHQSDETLGSKGKQE